MSRQTAVTGSRPAERPGTGTLLLAQLRYTLTDLWRSRVVLVFSFALPLVWLLVIGAAAGNEVLDEATGLRVMQFATPSAVAMGVLFASYPPVAIGLAEARERGIVKRFRGTPLPPWLYVAGRIGGAVVFASAATLLAVMVGVLGFGVQIIGRTAPATVVTVLLGIACFAALGLAVAALSPTAVAAQATSVSTAVVLAFISGVFTIGGELPWMATVGSVFPLRPFAEALQDQFDPFSPGAGWDAAGSAVLLVWGLTGALIAARFLGRGPGARGSSPTRRSPAPTTGGTMPHRSAGPTAGRRPGAARMVLGQAVAANRSTWRDGGSVFFALAMPVGLYALFVTMAGADTVIDGVPFPTLFAASMAVWGSGVTAFLNLPESVATARDRGVLKRLRGTPLTPWQYLAGRTTAALWLSVVVAALVLAVGTAFFDVRVPTDGLLMGLPVLVIGTLALAACGFVLAALLPDARAVGAVGLVVLLPLAFFSEVFFLDGPEWMRSVGALFPLLHFQNALTQAWDPAGAELAWSDLAVLVLWGVVAAAVAVRSFRWQPRSGGRP
ncbi:ABC transporter permease [Modestobacter sp. VKM Ac-2979]|uniref:ABC transporter permease n=1 Tax=unclassified Modestobacter TaxID=2643866 RepID=UPI0022AB6002|nr:MULTISPECIES: ABC transporter permease [unclassified Modestobacter]MCZ2812100.1 ABC transporter permease [Modestobacter sp. VKM Ac-2979]MCZ2843824.1 ABC transporter permease [Modestobacter sp. VKM Ac-2980]